MNNKAMYALSYGLFVLCARRGEKDNGCITNTAIQVTTTPNRIVVAINKDEDAPIFDVADVGIVGDVMKVLPAMIEEIRKRKAE